VEVGASWTAAVAAMAAAAAAVVEETEEGKCDSQRVSSQQRKESYGAQQGEASTNGNTRECYKTKHSTEETRKKKKKKKERGVGRAAIYLFFLFWVDHSNGYFCPPKKKDLKIEVENFAKFPQENHLYNTYTHTYPYIHVVIHVCKLNPLCLNYIHGCFFLGGCAQCFFFPEFFCHFWDKHIAKFFGKKFNLFCNFLGGTIHQKKFIPKKKY